MKARVRTWLLGAEAIPEYAAIGLRAPQTQVQVWLHGLTPPLDVTRNHSIAALRPLTIAICLPLVTLPQTSCSLVFKERDDAKPLGYIRLRLVRTIAWMTHQLCLFETIGHSNYCLPWPRLQLWYLYRWWVRRKRLMPHNFQMVAAELHSLYVFYTCPRPVVLVTVSHEAASNIFPMDLIGPSASGHFLLALRNTAPAVRLMEQSRRMVLSDIPVAYTDSVYALGAHHKKERVAWEALPFETTLSPTFALPMPRAALAVREVQVEQTQRIGSHTLFITTMAHEQTYAEGLQLFHVQGFYQHWLKQQGRAL
jgi:flavin reductase (DIM6/NTAB) family NADH-FMN oxidoreductase RutF